MDIPRYHLFHKNRTCACCGVIGNRLFLDKDLEQSKLSGEDRYHLNLYAENRSYQTGNLYFILMVAGRILPTVQGGEYVLENLQPLCFNCSSIREATGFKLTLEEIQAIMFPAFRAYRTSHALNETKKLTHAFRQSVNSDINGVQKIQEAIDKSLVVAEKQPQLKQRIVHLQARAEALQAEINRVELEAQISGTISNVVELVDHTLRVE